MGTNFYIEENEKHIGKSSAGWCFALHVYPQEGINTLDDWKQEWAGKQIINEYGEPVTEEQMLNHICKRTWDQPGRYNNERDEDFLKMNCAELGPNNLLRHAIDGMYTIGHGDETWDYCVGEFS